MHSIYNIPLPSGWLEEPLGTLVETKRGCSWSKEQERDRPVEGTIPVIRIPNIQSSLDLTDLLHIDGLSAEQRASSAVTKGWTLLVGSNGNPKRIGDSVLMEEDREMIFASFLFALRPKPNEAKISNEFIACWLHAHRIHEFISETSQMTTGLANISWSACRKLPVRFPNSEDEQTRIAETLKAADDYIRALEDQIRKAERVKKALLREFFIAEPRRRNEPRECRPWKTNPVRLTQCGVIATGGTPDRSNPSYFDGDILWVKSGEVDFNVIESTEEHITPEAAESINGKLYPVGTVLIAMYGAGVTRGRSAILAKPAYVNQAIASIECNSCTDNRWLFYWFQRNYHRVRGFAGGANQDNLNLYLIQGMKLSRPELPKQEEIAETLTVSDAFIRSLHTQLTAARRVKQSLLQNLLTGKIRLRA